MEDTKLLNHCSLLTIFLINILLFSFAKSEVFTVGDEARWSTNTNYLTWSQKYNFSVGDVLVFKYVKVQHNAYEVTQATYQSCDTSTGVLARYESGNDEVNLTEAKKYWFICDKDGHCLGGMRFTIDVQQQEASPTTNNNTSTGSTPQPNFDKNYASKTQSALINCLIVFGALLGFFLFII